MANRMRSLAARVFGVSTVMRLIENALCMARSTTAAGPGYCRLMKKERISMHLPKNHCRHCKDVLNVETVKREWN